MNLYEKIEKVKMADARVRMYNAEYEGLAKLKMYLPSVQVGCDPIQTSPPDINPGTRRIKEQINELAEDINKEIESTLILKREIISLIEGSTLSELEKIIARLKCLNDLSDCQIGKMVKCSESTVRRTRKAALEKLAEMTGDGGCGARRK